MNTQLQLPLTTSSPINVDRLSGQNKRLYDHLMAGNRIHCFHPALSGLRIGYLNSRISDLINKHQVPVLSQFITIKSDEGDVHVKEYWIEL